MSKACDRRQDDQLGASAKATVVHAQKTLSVTEASSSSARPPPFQPTDSWTAKAAKPSVANPYDQTAGFRYQSAGMLVGSKASCGQREGSSVVGRMQF